MKNLIYKLRTFFLKDSMDFSKIKNVEVETFSFCNRKCWFCPNSFIDRSSKNIEMEDEVYFKILKELKEINFSGKLSFSRYNEPLSQKELILKRLQQAREYLPNAKLAINTNGDYLNNRAYLEDLKCAGLNFLHIQFYLNKNEEFEVEKIVNRADNLAKKLNLDYSVIRKNASNFNIKFNYEDMEIVARARNFKQNGNNRGGLLDIKNKYKRKFPCLIPYYNLYIDYNGCLVPCCNLRSDVKEHEQFIIGNVKSETLKNIYNAKKQGFCVESLRICQ